jgi:hypothetical protein
MNLDRTSLALRRRRARQGWRRIVEALMQLERRWLAVSCALGLAAAIASAGDASALTLFDLNPGGGTPTFTVASGLTFSNFHATVTGALSPGLAQYAVQPVADGFVLSGPLVVTGGGIGNLLLTYDVTALAPIQVSGASLSGPGLTIGAGAFAGVGESLFDPASAFLGSLLAYDIVGGGSVPGDSITFGPVSKLSVVKNAMLGGGGFAMFPSSIGQRFQLVPEPVSMLLLTMGLVGLAWWRPRRMIAD